MARALVLLLLSAVACSSGSGSGSSTDGAPPQEKTDAGTHSSKGVDAGTHSSKGVDAGGHSSSRSHDAAVPRDSGKAVDAGKPKDAGSSVDAGGISGAAIAALALAQVGLGACSTNTLGGTGFEVSCTGYYGQPEYWCGDFAMWVWLSSGVPDPSSELGAAVTEFVDYGQTNKTLSDKPVLGAAAIFQMSGSDNHVAIVTQVNTDGTIETVSGDWEGTGSTEPGFASTSKVVLNAPAYPDTIGSTPGVMGQTLYTFVLPLGLAK